MTDADFVQMLKQDWFVANGISEACRISKQIAYTEAQCHMAIAAANDNAIKSYVGFGFAFCLMCMVLAFALYGFRR